MKLCSTFSVWILVLLCHRISSGSSGVVEACTFYVSNKCPFPIWPATAPNQGFPVVANGGFYLPSGRLRKFQAPGDWSGRIWARTGCNFDYSNDGRACETGDCNGRLECAGAIGVPPVTLVEFTLQVDKRQPSFYDVSTVDGYNLPVSVTPYPTAPKCYIGGCFSDIKKECPRELAVLNELGQVVACKSACLAFNEDRFCCRKKYGSPATCKPDVYSRFFKAECPYYFSKPFDTPSPLVNCPADQYIITFCPDGWGAPATSLIMST
ncbi:thaumatin-like protein [Coffea eugenioides]|uniref:thaumatin-like protein n=1 Tax=Coffea eugenioides TaxID=49369 RepID=UPI000F614181|nr:thaumatin-like protein [Coffea eugenioides]